MVDTEPIPDQEARAARNESVFRGINERIEKLTNSFEYGDPMSDWICECANPVCTDTLKLTRAEYEGVRQAGARFLVAPSDEHVLPEIERVVSRHDRYWVVEKVGVAQAVAEALDPRSSTPGVQR